ncbi:hypothetical protein Forpi1262_v015212 [Fusarium oxysporum f. sp. raphani]|uniref:Uncharacterized protein n=1 Tax=Fusarium oxysporum f. sp. raphani TaxID=96318 RepID=A0A8J5PPF3_FUSOX|nr:hypothetical protein Forpi1262_v015212 [Fusarium oxysporum f. sp. raphani]
MRRTGNNDEDDLDPEGKDDDGGDGDWDSEDDELDHDDSAYGSDQAEFSEDTYPELRSQAGGELDIAAFDNFLELLYEVCLTLLLSTTIWAHLHAAPIAPRTRIAIETISHYWHPATATYTATRKVKRNSSGSYGPRFTISTC